MSQQYFSIKHYILQVFINPSIICVTNLQAGGNKAAKYYSGLKAFSYANFKLQQWFKSRRYNICGKFCAVNFSIITCATSSVSSILFLNHFTMGVGWACTLQTSSTLFPEIFKSEMVILWFIIKHIVTCILQD